MKDSEIRGILRETEKFIQDQLARDPRVTGVIEKTLNILSVQCAALDEIARGAYSENNFSQVVVEIARQSQDVGGPPADAVRGG